MLQGIAIRMVTGSIHVVGNGRQSRFLQQRIS